MSLEKFIPAVNSHLQKLFDSFTSAKLHGLAKTIIKKQGSVSEMLPVLDGTETDVGIDDTYPLIAYHKANGINSQILSNGVGDSIGDVRNTYSISIIVFLDSDKTKLRPDELALFIQANMPEKIKIEKYKSVYVRIQNIILNSIQVYAGEYGNTDYPLSINQNLFSVNYQIESTFKKDCFDKCP